MAFGKRRRERRMDASTEQEPAAPEDGSPDEPGAGDSGPGESESEEASERPERDFGPWDSSQVDSDDEGKRVDVGAMRIPVVPGLSLRVDVTKQGTVAGVRLTGQNSEIQLGAFAAPKTAGIWDEIRETIRESLISQGGSAADAEGPWGPELRATVPTPNGPVPGRFIGVDGPRWFLRALILGVAARDSAAAEPYESVLRDLVVVRSDEAMPVREPIPIVLPDEVMAQLQAGSQAREAAQGGPSAPRPPAPRAPGSATPGSAPPGSAPPGSAPKNPTDEG